VEESSVGNHPEASREDGGEAGRQDDHPGRRGEAGRQSRYRQGYEHEGPGGESHDRQGDDLDEVDLESGGQAGNGCKARREGSDHDAVCYLEGRSEDGGEGCSEAVHEGIRHQEVVHRCQAP
jgi:hypothetical protein